MSLRETLLLTALTLTLTLPMTLPKALLPAGVLNGEQKAEEEDVLVGVCGEWEVIKGLKFDNKTSTVNKTLFFFNVPYVPYVSYVTYYYSSV